MNNRYSRRKPVKIADNAYLQSLLSKCNPFGLTQADGKFAFFNHPQDAYLFVMTTAYTYFPKGYIEVPLLLQKLYPHLSFKDCRFLLFDMNWFGVTEVTLLSKWDNNDTKNFFTNVMSFLCSNVGTSFRSDYLQFAWQAFIYRIQIDKNEKNGKQKEK